MLPNLSNLSKLSLEESNRPQCLPCGLDTMANLQAATWPCNEDGNCAICLETLNKDSPSSPFVGSGPFIVAVCSNQHIYHKGCILQYIYTQRVSNRGQTCPDCRNPVNSQSVYEGWNDRFRQSVEKGKLSKIKEKRDDEEENCNTDERDPTRKLRRDNNDDSYEIWEGKRNSMSLVEREYYERSAGGPRLVLKENIKLGLNGFYEGQAGQERLVRVESSNGVKRFFEGPAGQERLVRLVSASGIKHFYEGPAGEERLVRRELPDGVNILYYEGPDGQERKVREELENGVKHFYEGPHGQERKVREEYPNGTKHFYEGPRGQERLVRKEFPDGAKQFYEGPADEERLVRRELPDGVNSLYYYEGPDGQERLVRRELPDGSNTFYEGPDGQEREVRTEYPDGSIHFYEGAAGEERIERQEFPDGTKVFYDSGYDEYIDRVEHPDGRIDYYAFAYFDPSDDEDDLTYLERTEYPDGTIHYFDVKTGKLKSIKRRDGSIYTPTPQERESFEIAEDQSSKRMRTQALLAARRRLGKLSN